jgi:predicted permease
VGLLTGGFSTRTIEVDGFVPKADRDRESHRDRIGPGYFSTLGVPLVAGREIGEGDREGARVCVINEAFAKRYLGARNPIGLRVTEVADDGTRTPYQIVGVARDAQTQALRAEVEPRYFVPAEQSTSGSTSPTFLIRTATETAPVLASVRETVQRLHPNLRLISARTMAEQLAPWTAEDRLTARLAVVFSAGALTLAAIGLYGVLSYGVSRRTGEIAMRVALGAQPGRVAAMILGETTRLVAVGLAAGAALAFWAARLIEARLYGVPPRDPLTLISAAALLLAVALGAAYWPARRASRLDITTALRQG